jgi:hypothetical protein
VFSQETEIVKLDKNIKDKKGLIKSLTVIDNRPDKNIGTLTDAKKSVALKFENENLKNYIEDWFLGNNTNPSGKKDLVLVIEDITTYSQKDEGNEDSYSKLSLKISSFQKINNKYFFISRFNNVAVYFLTKPKQAQNYFADLISNVLTNFIKSSYIAPISQYSISENELNSYEYYITQNFKAFNSPELKDGIYKTYKNFASQEPSPNFSIERNKKGNPKRLLYNNEEVSFNEIYGYVENGKAYKLTPVGFDEMKRNENGYYITSSRNNIFIKNKNSGAINGALYAGGIGAFIGNIMDSTASKNAGGMESFGNSTKTQTNVYLDFLTGNYIFTE